MEAYVLGVCIIGTFFLLAYNQRRIINEMNKESHLLKENLNHVAGAIVGLSELLEEADQVIEDASRIPTVGEMVQQMLMGFIAQKMQPAIAPLQNTINQVGPQVETWLEKDEEKAVAQEETPQ
jgi:hypothetical protein